ncbi:MAG: hypothetical protein M3444_00250, partial [Acidobacteriota bacterium]|nr:hypothetical protein [Acidobacteriota bacterium]
VEYGGLLTALAGGRLRCRNESTIYTTISFLSPQNIRAGNFFFKGGKGRGPPGRDTLRQRGADNKRFDSKK